MHKYFSRFRLGAIALSASAIFAFSAFVPVAFAGVGIGVAPNFPGTVVVGQANMPVSMDITNTSSGGVTNIDLTSIRLTPLIHLQ